MSTFSVFLNDPHEDAWKAVRENWPDRHFIVNDRLAVIVPEGIALTADIAKTLGMTSESEAPVWGIVCEFSAYSGFNSRSLWEWLAKADK